MSGSGCVSLLVYFLIPSLAEISSISGAGKPADESEEARPILADWRRHAFLD